MESQGYLGILHSNPLGVMCQSFSRCIAACLAIADPDRVDGAAIFFCSGGCERAGRIPPEPEASHVRHRSPEAGTQGASCRAGTRAGEQKYGGAYETGSAGMLVGIRRLWSSSRPLQGALAWPALRLWLSPSRRTPA